MFVQISLIGLAAATAEFSLFSMTPEEFLLGKKFNDVEVNRILLNVRKAEREGPLSLAHSPLLREATLELEASGLPVEIKALHSRRLRKQLTKLFFDEARSLGKVSESTMVESTDPEAVRLKDKLDTLAAEMYLMPKAHLSHSSRESLKNALLSLTLTRERLTLRNGGPEPVRLIRKLMTTICSSTDDRENRLARLEVEFHLLKATLPKWAKKIGTEVQEVIALLGPRVD